MIQIIFGLPRSGKSTLLTALCQKAILHKPLRIGFCRFGSGVEYQRVYSNFPMNGAFKLDFDKLGVYNYHDALILIDEISLFCDSRNFKNFGDNLKMFFALHGHAHLDILACSQSFMDCDVKIRRMATDFFLIEKTNFGHFSRISPIHQFVGVKDRSIVDNYIVGGFFQSGFLNRKSYYRFFDSFSMPKLQEFEAELWNTAASSGSSDLGQSSGTAETDNKNIENKIN